MAPPEQAHHVAHVLRLAAGDAVVVFDGRGFEYSATIERISKSGVTLKVGEARAVDRESPLAVTLAQGISSGERMDYTVQKAVELGVAAIQPLATERSVVRLDPARAAKRLAHWQAVVISACEQCGRNRVPTVLPVTPLSMARRKCAGSIASHACAGRRLDAACAHAPGGTDRLARGTRRRIVTARTARCAGGRLHIDTPGSARAAHRNRCARGTRGDAGVMG